MAYYKIKKEAYDMTGIGLCKCVPNLVSDEINIKEHRKIYMCPNATMCI